MADLDKGYKMIAILGKERGDMVFYIAQVLTSAGKNVLILDNSGKNDLHTSITANYDDKEVGQIGKITVLKNKTTDSFMCSAYDYVIAYVGNARTTDRKVLVDKADFTYVIASGNLLNNLEAAETLKYYKLELEGKKKNVIILEKLEKISEKQILDELSLTREQVSEIYDIQPDEQLTAARINLTRFGNQSVKGVSEDVKEFLCTLYNFFFPEYGKKEVERAKHILLSGKGAA